METSEHHSSGRHRAPGHTVGRGGPARPGSRGPRLDGLDAARGLAVVSMLVAHLSPVGGVLDVSEYLTAPLFAVAIAASMGLVLARPDVDRLRFVLDNVLRGVLLLLVGVVLQSLYGQIDVVLPYLGILVIVLAPLAVLLRGLPVLALGLAAGGAVLGPLVTERARDHVLQHPELSDSARDTLLWLATGPSYRLVSFLPMALGGLVLALLLPLLGSRVRGASVAAVLLGAGAAVHVLGRLSEGGAAPYSGTTPEVVAATFLACGAVVASFAVVETVRVTPVAPVLHPVLSLGRLAFTAYVVQVLYLAVVSAVRGGARDDTWFVLLSTTVVVVGVCWLLDRRWGTGPFEVLARAVRVPPRPEPEEDDEEGDDEPDENPITGGRRRPRLRSHRRSSWPGA